MKNFKKVLSLVLALAMVLSTMTISFAATKDMTTEQKAEVLNELGLMNGVSTDGTFDAGLDLNCDAAQAIKLIGSALNWEDEADFDLDAQVEFTDLQSDQYAWAWPYVDYAVRHNITNGVSTEGKIFGLDQYDGKRVVAWFLTALGYPKNWETVEADAAELGIVIPTDNGRRAVVDAIYNGLTLKTYEGETTLIENIVAANPELKEIAIENALMPEEPDELDFVVEPNGLHEFTVVFNMPLDEETVDNNNFDLEDEDGDNVKLDVTLEDDERTVTVTVKDNSGKLDNQEKYTLEVEDVKTVDGLEIETKKVEFKTADFEAPEIVEYQVTGPKEIKFICSEPISEKASDDASVELKPESGSTIKAKSSMVFDGNEVTVTLLSKMKEDVDYEMTIEDFKDYADYTMIDKNIDFTYQEDNSEITAEITKSTEKYAVVEFSKPVDDIDNEVFYHEYSSWKAISVFKTEDKMDDFLDNPTKDTKQLSISDSTDKVYVVFATKSNEVPYTSSKFENHPLQSGENVITIKTKNGDDDYLEDNWDNKFNGATLTVNVVADTTKPEVEKIELDEEYKITVTFSEDVTDVEKSDFEVIDKDGKKVSISITKIDGDEVEFQLNDGDDYKEETIKIKISDIKDTSLQENEMDSYSQDLYITDSEKPEVSKVLYELSFDDDKDAKGTTGYRKITKDEFDVAYLYVYFNKDVDETTATDLGNYVLKDGSDLTDLDEEVNFFDGNDCVRIELNYEEAKLVEGKFTLDASVDEDVDLLVSNVKDEDDNKMNAKVRDIVAKGFGAPKVNEIKVTDTDTLEIKFDQVLDTVEDEAFLFFENSAETDADKALKVDEIDTKEDDGETIVTVTFEDADFSADYSTLVTGKLEVIGKSGDNKYLANNLDVEANNAKYTTKATYIDEKGNNMLEDEIKPEVVSLEDDDDYSLVAFKYTEDTTTKENIIMKAAIKFTEDIDVTSVSAGAFDTDLDVQKAELSTTDASVIILTFEQDEDYTINDDLTITIRDGVLRDKSKNELEGTTLKLLELSDLDDLFVNPEEGIWTIKVADVTVDNPIKTDKRKDAEAINALRALDKFKN